MSSSAAYVNIGEEPSSQSVENEDVSIPAEREVTVESKRTTRQSEAAQKYWDEYYTKDYDEEWIVTIKVYSLLSLS